MKALEILKNLHIDVKKDVEIEGLEVFGYIETAIEESIKELEEFNNRSCKECIFVYRDKNKKIDDVQGQVLGSKARWSYCKKIMINVTKDFCCNRWESNQ